MIRNLKFFQTNCSVERLRTGAFQRIRTQYRTRTEVALTWVITTNTFQIFTQSVFLSFAYLEIIYSFTKQFNFGFLKLSFCSSLHFFQRGFKAFVENYDISQGLQYIFLLRLFDVNHILIYHVVIDQVFLIGNINFKIINRLSTIAR